MGKKARVVVNAVPFTNSLEQVIAVNDNVVVITSGYNLRIRKGRYVGSRPVQSYRKDAVRVCVEIDEVKTVLEHKVTKVPFKWDYRNTYGVDVPPHPEYYLPGSGYNRMKNPNYETEKAAHNAASTEVSKRRNADIEENYHNVKYPYVRRSHLWLNNVFPLAGAIDSIVGQNF